MFRLVLAQEKVETAPARTQKCKREADAEVQHNQLAMLAFQPLAEEQEVLRPCPDVNRTAANKSRLDVSPDATQEALKQMTSDAPPANRLGIGPTWARPGKVGAIAAKLAGSIFARPCFMNRDNMSPRRSASRPMSNILSLDLAIRKRLIVKPET